jgi:hypothetical protein
MLHTAHAGKKLLHRRATLLLAVALVVFSTPAAGRCADKPAVSELVEKLKDKRKEVRLRAVKALGDLGTPAKAAVPDLLECLRDKDLEVQRQASQSLAQVGPAAVPALREALADEQARVRGWAANALGLLAPDSKDAVAALLEAAKDKDAGVRVAALKGLLAAETDPQVLEPVLQAAAKDIHPYVSLLGASSLDQLKAKADGKRAPALLAPFPVLAVRRLTPDQEAQMDRMIDTFIAFDIHDETQHLPPAQHLMARQLASCLNQLGPESIPALVRGVNKAGSLYFYCGRYSC